MGLMRLGRHDEAAAAALQAAAQPTAHLHILTSAMHCLALDGRVAEAGQSATAIQRVQPAYGVDDYRRALRFDEAGQALIRQAARRIERP